jgi:hypothetical protein
MSINQHSQDESLWYEDLAINNACNNCSVGGPMENFNNPGVIMKYAEVDPWVDRESGFLFNKDPVAGSNFDCNMQVLRMENRKIDDKINNSSVMVLMENDEPLRDAGQTSIHACIISTVVVTTEESDNPEDIVDIAEGDWDNQSALLLNVDNNITGVYPHNHNNNNEVVEQCDDEVIRDTEGGDVIKQTIKQEPVNEMPVAATTSKLRTSCVMTDTTGVRVSNPGGTTGVKSAPAGVEAATTAATNNNTVGMTVNNNTVGTTVNNDTVGTTVEGPPATGRRQRVRNSPKSFVPSMQGRKYSNAMTVIMEKLYGKTADQVIQLMGHELRKAGEDHWPEVTGMCIVQLSLQSEQILRSSISAKQKKNEVNEDWIVLLGDKLQGNINEDDARLQTALTKAIAAVGYVKKRNVKLTDIPDEHTMISWDKKKHRVIDWLHVLRVNVLYEITLDGYLDLEYIMIEEEAQDLVEDLGGYCHSLQVGCWMHLLTGGFRNDKNYEKVVDDTIAWLKEEYVVMSDIEICRGKIYNYLNETLYNDVNKVLDIIQVHIGDGIVKVKKGCKSKLRLICAPRDPLEANEECKKRPRRQAEYRNDWESLSHFIIMSDRDGILQTDINNVFNVHSDLNMHYMSTNNGTVKLNMSSLTEFGLVDKGKSLIWWADHFMTAQKYQVELEVNSKASSWKQMRQINIQYFFITDWVKNRQCEMRWNCEENLVDSEDIMGSVLVQW